MNRNQIEGRMQETKGKAEEKLGRIAKKPNLWRRGKLDQAAGKAEKTYGDVKDDLTRNAPRAHDE